MKSDSGIFILRVRLVWLPVLFIFALIWCPALTAGELGDSAPALQVNTWIQGGPVDLKAGLGKNIFVIEFWQTECPHCLESLPLLSVLQHRHRDAGVVIIGISSEDPATVSKFMQGKEDILHTVATDADDKTYTTYMDAFGVSGVPHTFVVGRQGRILWQGHPLDGLEDALAQVVAGQYDLAEARNVSRAQKLLTAYVYLSIETDEADIASQVGNRLYAYGKNNSALLIKLARFIVGNQKVRRPDLVLAERAAGRACALTGEIDRVALETYAGVLHRLGAAEKSRQYRQKAEKLSAAAKPAD